MPLTNFPNGITSFGMPVMGSGHNTTTGNLFFVDSGGAGASDGNTGKDPGHPLATLNGAVAKATANNGDIVFLMPGHAENVSAVTTQVIGTAGLTFVGLGSGSDAPTFTYTAAAGSVVITGANTKFENVRFVAAVEQVANAFAVYADGATFLGCDIDWSGAGSMFFRVFDAVNVNKVSVQQCSIKSSQYNPSSTSGFGREVVRMAGADQFTFEDNVVYGYWTNAAIYGTSETSTDTVGAGPWLVAQVAAVGVPGSTGLNVDMNLARNTIHNYATTTSMANGVAQCVDINTASVGTISRNALSLSAAGVGVALALDPGSCRCIENYAIDNIDEHAVVVPPLAADTTTA